MDMSYEIPLIDLVDDYKKLASADTWKKTTSEYLLLMPKCLIALVERLEVLVETLQDIHEDIARR